MAKPEILLISQFAASSQNYCYAEFLYKLMLEQGKNVRKFDCKRSFFPGPKSADELPKILRYLNNWLINLQLFLLVLWLKPQQLFLVKGENISYRLLKTLKSVLKFKLLNFYPDSPFCLWNGNSSANILQSLALYDGFAIWSRELQPILYGAGVKTTFFWPFLPDETLFFPEAKYASATSCQYTSDVCFVGSWDEKRSAILTALHQKLPKIDLKIWGLGWQNLPQNHPLNACIIPKALTPAQMRQAFVGSKIVLNFLRPQNLGAHNMRTLETVACGAFLLTERSHAQAQELLLENVSVACFEGSQELCEKVDLYLNVNPLREKIAQAGYRRLLQLQTEYRGQFNQFLKL